ncbi:hypothetical protein CspHIS471_0611280 [Cutaneotrichosporon sp. HIS471]|nr:hypothetical protein CspHIS471_0611280 [Cutaneotrichosporon sp. HIS471]
MSPKPDVVVLGAGVIGLSIALELDAAGFRVAIVGKDLPGDSNAVDYASPWAGCLWFSYDTDTTKPVYKRDVRTFQRLQEMVHTRPDLVQWYPILSVSGSPMSKDDHPWADDVKVLTAKDGLPGGFAYGTECQTLMMNAPQYMLYLGEQVRARGIPMVKKRLNSVDEAYSVFGKVDLVVNASGLGAQALVGAADPAVYSARGVTVLARAPKVIRAGQVMDVLKATFAGGEQPPPTYILPRPGTDGHVVLGGTYDAENYSPLPSTEIVEGILQRTFALDSNLAPGGTWRDIEVLGVNVGLRPSRKNGQRVELERRRIGDRATAATPTASLADRGRSVGVIHAYGFGGVGFISSLGAAEDVVALAKEFKTGAPARL